MSMLTRLTTGYLLVCPLLGALVLNWSLDSVTGLTGMVAFATYTILHIAVVGINSALVWDGGVVDGMRLEQYSSRHTTRVEE